jgi:alpha/beta superfamily hydrolase
MDNNVILALGSTFANSSLIAFMFNFRGVGKSDGNFGGGIAEQEDVAAAVNWLTTQPEVDTSKIGLAGYSFGASVALSVACSDKRIKAMALISPPLGTCHIDQLKHCIKPKLVISGSADDLIQPENVELLFREAAEPKQLELIPGADHFLFGHEIGIADTAANFFHTSLKPA